MTEDEMVGWHHRLNGHEVGHDLPTEQQYNSNNNNEKFKISLELLKVT